MSSVRPPCFEPREDLPEVVLELAKQLHRATEVRSDLCELLVNIAGELERALHALERADVNHPIDVGIARMMIRAARRLSQ